ncbi:adenylate/guanylate cyclase domain-containing protein [bacterium]|nr:adenylate/guanylate cyclase domain-containing protein [bacterium]
MRKQGLGLAGKLIIIFSILYGVLLAGVLGISIHFFVVAKQNDARYRIVDVINSIHLARKRMGDAELKDYLTELFSTRFRAEGYDLDILDISIHEGNKVLRSRRADIQADKTQRFHTEIRDPESKRIVYTIDLSYSLLNLEKGIWNLVWQVAAVGAAAFIAGLALILYFARRSTSHLRTLADAMQQAGSGNMGARVEIQSSDEVGVLGDTFNWMMKGLEEGEFVKNIFKRYVTRQVAEKILAEKDMVHLAGDRLEVSILFADIRGFTRLSQTMPPEEIIGLLNHYFTPIIDVIIENEGVLDKFIGDGFLAFWNAPLPQKDHALRACKAAIEIQNVITKLNLARENLGKISIKMGMGIHSGAAIAGSIGSARRMEYTIIGESVNFAERLEEAAEHGEVLVSKRVKELIAERMPLKERRIKIQDYGEQEIEVFELLIPKEALQ